MDLTTPHAREIMILKSISYECSLPVPYCRCNELILRYNKLNASNAKQIYTCNNIGNRDEVFTRPYNLNLKA